MTDVTIDVQLAGNDVDGWQVIFPNGGGVDMTYGETDTIQWTLVSSPYGAEITNVVLANGTPGNVVWPGTPPEAPAWKTTETDHIPGTEPVSWSYNVTVTYQGVPYVSDPEIVNEPEP